MSSIFLDPVGMDATAAAVGEHARELQTLTSTLESACSAIVPVALAGWLNDELRAIAVHSQLTALLYTVAALDTALRAQQIQADQSLVAAQPELATTSVDLGAALASAGSTIGGSSTSFDIVDPSGASVDLGAVLAAAGSTIGGSYVSVDVVDPSGVSVDLSSVLVRDAERGTGKPSLANNPFLLHSSMLASSNPGLAAQHAALGGWWNDINVDQGRGHTNSRTGVSFTNGLYHGPGGRTGPNARLDPYQPGTYVVG